MSSPITPRTFYLNEQHELARSEKDGGGRVPKYPDINWASKGKSLALSLERVTGQILQSPDPAKANHYYLLAAPVEELAKESTAQKAVDGRLIEQTNFAEKHSRVFRRLGLDLISVADDGSAVVHMKPELMEQLSNTARSLPDLGAREKSRWATIENFAAIPSEFRIDPDWVESLTAGVTADAVIEFQPLLTRSEIDALIRAVVSVLVRDRKEAITGTGSDFSGRQWLRGGITPESLKEISRSFSSVQSLHSPLISITAAQMSVNQKSSSTTLPEIDTTSLPVIGILDTGVSADHAILAKYRRGTYVSPRSNAVPGDGHGCFVSSRAVFGDPDYSAGPPPQTPVGTARYYDINISGSVPKVIEDKEVYPALQAIVATSPDVRVFNMSFDSELPLDQMTDVKAAEALRLVQDLDNFIYQNDILVVVAAGNSRLGLIPAAAYPRHFDDPQWGLGTWARSFNALTCGSSVEHLSAGGLVTQVGWPSPFCRVGPGLNGSFKPDFSANGGNGTPEYQYSPGLGVWGLSPSSMWEDWPGTSFAAPLLAREAAFALQRLEKVCQRGAQPFSTTVKAFLALTALSPVDDRAVNDLAQLTLGRGTASAHRLDAPTMSSGIMIWQGVLEDDKDVARIQIPIPLDWLRDAKEPVLRLVVSWDPPVNAAVSHVWSTRDITVRLRTHPDEKALVAPNIRPRGNYPIIERLYRLNNVPTGAKIEGDSWLLEISYEQIAEYHPAMTFPPQQRVSFAAELEDQGETRLSPQNALQSLTVTQTMTRLTVPPTVSKLPVVLKTPV